MNRKLPKDYSREDMLFFNKKNYKWVETINEPIDSYANYPGEKNLLRPLMLKLKPNQYLVFKEICYYPTHIETKRMVCVDENKFHIIDYNQSISYVRCYWNNKDQIVYFS